jgi:hypothetical protein
MSGASIDLSAKYYKPIKLGIYNLPDLQVLSVEIWQTL